MVNKERSLKICEGNDVSTTRKWDVDVNLRDDLEVGLSLRRVVVPGGLTTPDNAVTEEGASGSPIMSGSLLGGMLGADSEEQTDVERLACDLRRYLSSILRTSSVSLIKVFTSLTGMVSIVSITRN